MREVRVINQSRLLHAPLRAGYCESFFCKLRGLTFRQKLPSDWGLLIVNEKDSRRDTAIHMLGVWFDLAIVWINNAGEVVDVRVARPWRSFFVPQYPARYILEIEPKWIADFQVGDTVHFEEMPENY